MTTRTQRADKIHVSVEALHYLRLLQASIGPVNAGFSTAYVFPDRTRRNRRGGTGRESSEKRSSEGITLGMAEEGSLWSQAGDFWAVVGWAFNCSVKHPARWDVWLSWLEHMIDVLQTDWDVCRAVGDNDDSLIVKYLGELQSRRILRAVFADGTKQSLQEFPEIWKKETAEKKAKTQDGYEKVKVDFEVEEFGNYFNVSEGSSEDEVPDPAIAPGGLDGIDEDSDVENFIDKISHQVMPDGAAGLGGVASLTQRMRLLSLLTQIAFESRDNSIDAHSLAGLINTYIRNYSLPLFSSVVSVTQFNAFPPAMASFVLQSLTGTLLESAAPRASGTTLSQSVLETSYLPWAATTSGSSDNAKLAICIETLTRLYDQRIGLRWTSKLESAVREGIRRREDKVLKDGRKKSDISLASSMDDGAWLRASGQRMTLLLQLVYRRADQQKRSVR